MQAVNPAEATTTAGIPHDENRRLTSSEEMLLIVGKRAFEELDKYQKSNQRILKGVQIFTVIAATVSFTAIKAVESHSATVALMIAGIASVIFFLISFTAYTIRTENKISIYGKALVTIYVLKKLCREFAEMVNSPEGCNLNPDDELYQSIIAKVPSLSLEIGGLENILRGIMNYHAQQTRRPVSYLRPEIDSLSEIKGVLLEINRELINVPPEMREDIGSQLIAETKKLSEMINSLGNMVQRVLLRDIQN